MSGATAGLLAALLAVSPAAFAEETEELLSLSGRVFAFERIGTLTSLLCAAEENSPECRQIEEMGLQPQVDWEKLTAKPALKPVSKKKAAAPPAPASQIAVDQHGGPWVFSLDQGSVSVKPDFPGYRLKLAGGKIAFVDVLRTPQQWEQACAELGLDPRTGKKAKRGLGGWLKN